MCLVLCDVFFFQAEDGIRDLVRSRGLGDVYKRQGDHLRVAPHQGDPAPVRPRGDPARWPPDRGQTCRRSERRRDCAPDGRPRLVRRVSPVSYTHLTLADERSSVDLGGRRIIKKKKNM